jgi:hypothetical protein
MMRTMRSLAWFALVVEAALGGCGARLGTPNPPSLDGGNGGGGGGDDAGPSCQPAMPCPAAGMSRCVVDQLQTCVDDGTGCLSWDAPVACPAGAMCTGGACVDACAGADLMTACTQAAKDVNNCCGGTLARIDALALCHAFVKAGKDPKAQCAAWTLQTTCDTVADALSTMGSCCCQVGYACDPENANRCVLTCTQKTSCSGSPGGSYCAPAGRNGVITEKAWLCRPDDGRPLHGCEFIANNGCDGGYDCWRDKLGNEFCTRSCNVDADCGNPGVACCNKTAVCNRIIGKCGGVGACTPCP